MNQMTLKELYEVGCSFESSVGEGTKSERARIPKNSSRITFDEDLTNNIINFEKEIKFLVAGEIWCPDYQLNGAVLKRFMDLNPNFDMSVITMARGFGNNTNICKYCTFKIYSNRFIYFINAYCSSVEYKLFNIRYKGFEEIWHCC